MPFFDIVPDDAGLGRADRKAIRGVSLHVLVGMRAVDENKRRALHRAVIPNCGIPEMLGDIVDCRIGRKRVSNAPLPDQMKIVHGNAPVRCAFGIEARWEVQRVNVRVRNVQRHRLGRASEIGTDLEHHLRRGIAKQAQENGQLVKAERAYTDERCQRVIDLKNKVRRRPCVCVYACMCVCDA